MGLGLTGAAKPCLVLFTGGGEGDGFPSPLAGGLHLGQILTAGEDKAGLWVTRPCRPGGHISQSSACGPSGLSLLSLLAQSTAPPGQRASKRGYQVLTGSGLKVLQATGSAPCLSRL